MWYHIKSLSIVIRITKKMNFRISKKYIYPAGYSNFKTIFDWNFFDKINSIRKKWFNRSKKISARKSENENLFFDRRSRLRFPDI